MDVAAPSHPKVLLVSAPGAAGTIAHYLALLGEALPVAPLGKYATRAAPPKLVPVNNALLAVMDP